MDWEWPKPETAPLQPVQHPIADSRGVALWIKREDLLHPAVSGNKWRKLKYNLVEAKNQGHHTLLTFGGAFSNHIFATAAAGKMAGLRTIGIIRGEEYLPLNHTLSFARSCGMELHYLDRSTYRQKGAPEVIAKLESQFGRFYLVPEGGTNLLAVKGCTEIVKELGQDFDYVTTCCGTGGTLAGLVAGLAGEKKALGYSVLKGGEFLNDEVEKLVSGYARKSYQNWKVVTDYHFGGYAKKKPELMDFISDFHQKTGIELEFVYTGKMMFGLLDMIEEGQFPKGSRIIALHTGGLQRVG